MRTSENNKGWLYAHLFKNEDEEEQKNLDLKEEEVSILNEQLEKNKIVNIIGPENSGKRYFVNESLETKYPTYFVNANDVNSVEKLKSMFRVTQKITFFEEAIVTEGVIISVLQNSIVLKTDEMESTFTLRKEEKLEEGEVVQIIDGKIHKLGIIKPQDVYDVNTKIVPIPKGDLTQKKIVSRTISISDLDRNNLESTVDEKLTEWIDRGKANLVDSLLVIDHADSLDKKILCYLKSIENVPFAPKILLISNVQLSFIKAGLFDLKTLDQNEIVKIFKKRIFFENIDIQDEIFNQLIEIQKRKGLKFALNLLFVLSTHSHSQQKSLTVSDLGMIADIYTSK